MGPGGGLSPRLPPAASPAQAATRTPRPWWGLPRPPLAPGCAVRVTVPPPGRRVPGAGPAGRSRGREHSGAGGTCRLGDRRPGPGVRSARCGRHRLRGAVHVPGPRVPRCFSAPRAAVTRQRGLPPPSLLSPGAPLSGMSMGTCPHPRASLPLPVPAWPGSRPRPRVPVLTCAPVSVPRLPVEDFSLDSSLSQ